jgi:hypothetical protein
MLPPIHRKSRPRITAVALFKSLCYSNRPLSGADLFLAVPNSSPYWSYWLAVSIGCFEAIFNFAGKAIAAVTADQFLGV